MEASCRRMRLALALTLQLIISPDDNEHSAAAASSPLAGTKIRTPWANPSSSGVLPGHRYTPSVFDVSDHQDLTKLLDVGACSTTDGTSANTFSYVPPLDGTNPNYKHTLCQDVYGMRFVLFDLKLVNIDTVDSLSGSFTAQFQLVFHWVEGWEAPRNEKHWFAYEGDPISTADDGSICGFYCDTTSASKTMCCDRMWVPPLQVPSWKVNDVQSVTPPPYLTTTYNDSEEHEYKRYSARRTWYVGLDVTCPFTPEFRNFPFDHQFLTVDIINPYASRTWLQLNKGFLDANIVDSIAGIDLSVDDKIDGWSIEDLTVSSACGTQQTWKPTFLTQDYLLSILGDHHYQSQNDTITTKLHDIKCAEMKDLIWNQDYNVSLSIPTNKLPYTQTKKDYMERLNTTIVNYKECTSSKFKEFKWRHLDNLHTLPHDVVEFKLNDTTNVNRSFSFLDLEYLKTPHDGINFECLIDAVANLTTPGIRINIVIQRFTRYYIVKLFLPTFACVAFSFTSFALGEDELLGRLTVIVPSAIALSALQGFVVATDIPAVAYIAPTTWIILLSYSIQLLIALECICFKIWPWIYEKIKNDGSTQTNASFFSPTVFIQVLDALSPYTRWLRKENRVDPQYEEDKGPTEDDKEDRSHQNDRQTQGESSAVEKSSDVDQSNENDEQTQGESSEVEKSSDVEQSNENDEQRQGKSSEAEKQKSRLTRARIIDVTFCGLLFFIYILLLALLGVIPLLHAESEKEKKLPYGYESLWN